jgi:hypothetical protein
VLIPALCLSIWKMFTKLNRRRRKIEINKINKRFFCKFGILDLTRLHRFLVPFILGFGGWNLANDIISGVKAPLGEKWYVGKCRSLLELEFDSW